MTRDQLRVADYLGNILEAIERIGEYTESSFPADSDTVNSERFVQKLHFVGSETSFDHHIGKLGIGPINHRPEQHPVEKNLLPVMPDVACQKNSTIREALPDSIDQSNRLQARTVVKETYHFDNVRSEIAARFVQCPSGIGDVGESGCSRVSYGRNLGLI